MTPADLEQAIEVNRRLLRRRRFNEETRKSEYHPPLTRHELGEMLTSEEQMYFPSHFPELTYADPSGPEHRNWAKAMRKLNRYLSSETYQTAALDAFRTRYDDEETTSQEAPNIYTLAT